MCCPEPHNPLSLPPQVARPGLRLPQRLHPSPPDVVPRGPPTLNMSLPSPLTLSPSLRVVCGQHPDPAPIFSSFLTPSWALPRAPCLGKPASLLNTLAAHPRSLPGHLTREAAPILRPFWVAGCSYSDAPRFPAAGPPTATPSGSSCSGLLCSPSLPHPTC